MKNILKISLLTVFTLGIIVCTSCAKDDAIPIITPTVQTEQQLVFKEFWDIYDRHYPLMHVKDINLADRL